MNNTKIQFPKNFAWGASIAAHQVEGGNVNDWSVWETANADRLAKESESKDGLLDNWLDLKGEASNPHNYISGKSAGHYERYEEDIKLARSLNLNFFRFSIEWSRIQPQEKIYIQAEIEHYRKVIECVRQNGMEPHITLQHRTLPVWISDKGGWQSGEVVDHFVAYAERIVKEFGSQVKYWMPINEPIMSIAGGYLSGVYPPSKKSFFTGLKVFNNMVEAQNRTFKLIHKHYPHAQVGLSHAAIWVEPYKNYFWNRILVWLTHYLANHKIFRAALYDFVGVQYYTRGVINLSFTKQLMPKVEQIIVTGPKTDMGWEIYPDGLYKFIKTITRYRKPIYITENGIADRNDTKRLAYIKDHLAMIHKAIVEGVDIRGYFYWSLLDNMEWNKGFWPRFGLIEVDYTTLNRTVRPSAKGFSEIVKNSGF